MTNFTVVHDDLFENLPDTWGYGPFGEYVDFQEGPGILAKDFHETGVPLLRLKSIVSSTATLGGCNFLNPEKVESKWSHFKLSIGDLLLSSSASLGRVSEVDESTAGAVAYTGIIRMRPANALMTKGFIRYFLQSRLFSHQIERSATGSVIKHFGPMHLKQMGITLPPIEDQKAIAHILGSLDDKIEINQKMNQTLEDIAKAIFKSWFVDFDPVRAKSEGRPTGLPSEISDLFPDELVDSEIGEIPKGWEVTPLQECAIEIESGRRPKGGIDKSLQQGIPSVGAESIAPAGEFDFSKVKYVTAEFAEKMKKGRVQNFDVALYKDGGKPGQFIPRVGIYGDGFPFDHFYVNEHVFLLRSEQLGQPFLYRLVSSPAFLDQLIAKGSAKAAQPGLNQTEVVESTFVCPGEDAITVFNSKTRPLLERQFLLGKENEVLSDLRDILLPKLISGELRIPDAEKFLEEAGL